MRPRLISLTLMFLSVSLVTFSQEQVDSRSGGFNIGFNNYGISFGNSPVHNGLRFNWSDDGIEQINGINFTIWKPANELSGSVNGIALGIVSPAADEISGIALGGLAVLGRNSLTGISFGSLAVVSSGTATGVTVGGLAAIGKDGLSGINVGGLACVSDGAVGGLSLATAAIVAKSGLWGFNAAGLAVVSQGPVTGFNFGGLATVGMEGISGFNFGGMALVTQGTATGFNVGGLAVVAKDRISGINLSGLALVASEGTVGMVNIAGLAVVGLEGVRGFTVAGAGIVSRKGIVGLNFTLGDLRNEGPGIGGSIKGISFAGYRIKSNEISGINLSLITVQAHNATGLISGVYNRVTGTQIGVSVGIFNHATELFGLQIGILNWAENNPEYLRILPILNLHL
ncbi:MAG TPA: hypothetical protein VMM37_10710 [Bacteroidota bacterium]|nr:hypothetical protein [Bacteroidota bacterium]